MLFSIYDCPTCGPSYKESNQRANHFDSAKWSYESARGKGSFKKDHPKLDAKHDELKKATADMHVSHLKHILEKVTPENGASTVPTSLLK